MEKVSTKDKILDAALTLFAEKGYDGVGVDQIAESIGIKGPSLYRHYKGKEAILDALMEKVGVYYDANFGTESKPGTIPNTLEELVSMSLGRINFTMHDPTIRKVRRILAMEQFRNPMIAEQATKHNLIGVRNMYEKIFERMIEAKLLKDEDPEMMATVFASPVTLLIQTYDRQPEKEQEIMAELKRHFEHFVHIYKV